jgi:hypothetical protein
VAGAATSRAEPGITEVELMILRTWLALALALLAGPAAASPGIAFETIPLLHVPACDIAPLLGSQFQYAPDMAAAGLGGRSTAQKSFPGVELITAAHPTSRYLLAAGTEQGVGGLRAFVRTVDIPFFNDTATTEIYTAGPADTAAWSGGVAAPAGIRVSTRALRPGEKLTFPALPRGYRARQISVTAQQGRPELMPLPLFSGWPQVLLATAVEAGSNETLRVGVGALGEGASPAGAVREALKMPNIQRLRAGEKLALVLSRGNSSITVILTTGG